MVPLRVDVGTRLKERLRDGWVAAVWGKADRIVKRCLTAIAPRVDVRTGGN